MPTPSYSSACDLSPAAPPPSLGLRSRITSPAAWQPGRPRTTSLAHPPFPHLYHSDIFGMLMAWCGGKSEIRNV